MILNTVAPTRKETVHGFVCVLLQTLLFPSIPSAINALYPGSLNAASSNFLLFALDFLLITLVLRTFLTENLRTALRQPWLCLRYAGIGLGIHFIGSFLFKALAFRLLPEYLNYNDQTITQLIQENYPLMAVSTVFLVPVTEEAIFRGLIFRNLYNAHPVWAYILSMTAFSAVHLTGYLGTAEPLTLCLSFLQYLPSAFALGWSYRKSGSIVSPILIHMTINQIGLLSMR